jgi:PIN domain nuclease of toxin-antitoxin system
MSSEALSGKTLSNRASISRNRYLLDTHTFIWLAVGDSRLSDEARACVAEPENQLLLSVASIWEMAIKKSQGRLELTVSLSDFVKDQLAALVTQLLDIRSEHALLVEGLPFHHRDPFDRLLVAQAIRENLIVVGADRSFDKYGVRRLW